jgi:hypothetical protein
MPRESKKKGQVVPGHDLTGRSGGGTGRSRHAPINPYEAAAGMGTSGRRASVQYGHGLDLTNTGGRSAGGSGRRGSAPANPYEAAMGLGMGTSGRRGSGGGHNPYEAAAGTGATGSLNPSMPGGHDRKRGKNTDISKKKQPIQPTQHGIPAQQKKMNQQQSMMMGHGGISHNIMMGHGGISNAANHRQTFRKPNTGGGKITVGDIVARRQVGGGEEELRLSDFRTSPTGSAQTPQTHRSMASAAAAFQSASRGSAASPGVGSHGNPALPGHSPASVKMSAASPASAKSNAHGQQGGMSHSVKADQHHAAVEMFFNGSSLGGMAAFKDQLKDGYHNLPGQGIGAPPRRDIELKDHEDITPKENFTPKGPMDHRGRRRSAPAGGYTESPTASVQRFSSNGSQDKPSPAKRRLSAPGEAASALARPRIRERHISEVSGSSGGTKQSMRSQESMESRSRNHPSTNEKRFKQSGTKESMGSRASGKSSRDKGDYQYGGASHRRTRQAYERRKSARLTVRFSSAGIDPLPGR